MASRHVRWVLANRQRYPDSIDRDIMVAIATHIGYDDQPARISMATIAEYAGCHYNTADKRTKALAEAGALVIGKSGRFLTYELPGSADAETRLGDEPPPGACSEESGRIDALEEQVAALAGEVRELTTIVTSLSHDLHIIVTSSSHDVHTSFTPRQSDDVNKEGKKGRREEVRQPRARASTEGPFIPAITQRINAILEVCGLNGSVPAHKADAENAAVQLDSYSAAEILERFGRPSGPAPGWNWYLHDFRGQKGDQPKPRWVVENISKQPPRPIAANGNGSGKQHEEIQLDELGRY